MAQPTPGSLYSVQQGDTLTSIAQHAYGDENLWREIYIANTEVIGENPNAIVPGMKLYILNNPRRLQVYLTTQLCKVTVDSLKVRTRPDTEAAVITSFSRGTVLNFTEVEEGENVRGNNHWGHSTQGRYFWMGGTDRPQG